MNYPPEEANCKAAESRPYFDAFDKADIALNDLHYEIARLDERLAVLTQPRLAKDDSERGQDVRGPISEMTSRLNAHVDRIQQASQRVNELLAYLDL